MRLLCSFLVSPIIKQRIFARCFSSLQIEKAKERLDFGEGRIKLDSHFSEGIALITLSNDNKHNALSGRMMVELHEIVGKLEKVVMEPDNDLVGLILWGQGRSFCAGVDLSGAREHLMTQEAGRDMSLLMQDTLTRLQRLLLVSVSAIEGAALGGGAELATATDFRILSLGEKTHMRFVQTEMGVTPGFGGASRLLNLVGRTRSLEFLTKATRIDQNLAVESGLAINVAAEAGEALAIATEYLEPIVFVTPKSVRCETRANDDEHIPRIVKRRRNVNAVRGMKRIISNTANWDTRSDLLELEHNIFTSLWGSEANQAAVRGGSKK